MTNFNEKNWENLKGNTLKPSARYNPFSPFWQVFPNTPLKPVKSQDWIDLTKYIYVFEQSQALTTIRNVSSLFLVLWNGVKRFAWTTLAFLSIKRVENKPYMGSSLPQDTLNLMYISFIEKFKIFWSVVCLIYFCLVFCFNRM